MEPNMDYTFGETWYLQGKLSIGIVIGFGRVEAEYYEIMCISLELEATTVGETI